jgi:hypothetical protein
MIDSGDAPGGDPMTQLLEQAFAAAARLPADDQDALARALLRDLASERAIDERLTGTPDALARLADEALAEHRAGRTESLDPDQL